MQGTPMGVMSLEAPVAAADELDPRVLDALVRSFLARREVYLSAAEGHGSPLYLIEPQVLQQRAGRFRQAFEAALPCVRTYYALKSNNHPAVAQTFLGCGLGIDVSSGIELAQALRLGAADIIFSGPGKTDDELTLALEAADRVTILVDSVGELDRLQQLARGRRMQVRAGVRLTTDEDGLWRKFGVPLRELPGVLARADSGNVHLAGLQFHISWNLGPERQIAFIRRLGALLPSLPRGARDAIRFLDIGGGFWPPAGEWLHDAVANGITPQHDTAERGALPRHVVRPASSIGDFAEAIAVALREHVFPWLDCTIHVEPGRWLCNDGMHVLLTVVDRKADDMVIVDAGTNAVGWERFESDYFPVINLSRPDATEVPCTIFGSLCTPHDLWGYAYHGAGIARGDVLLVPTQGAYTYSLRQDFIKPIPAVVERRGDLWCRLPAT